MYVSSVQCICIMVNVYVHVFLCTPVLMYESMNVCMCVCAKRAYYSYFYGWNQLSASERYWRCREEGGNDQDMTFRPLQSVTALVTRKNDQRGSRSQKVAKIVQF